MLVSKIIQVTTAPVEILAGSDTSQPYALHLVPDVSGAWLGDSNVVADTGSGTAVTAVSYPLLIQGESLWAVAASGTVNIRVFAYSTPGG